jgi:antitoxin ChpS
MATKATAERTDSGRPGKRSSTTVKRAGTVLAGAAGTSGDVRLRATLKKSGGSLILTVPAQARDALHLSEGQEMTVAVDGQRLVLEPATAARPVYTLEELLAQCDFDQPY